MRATSQEYYEKAEQEKQYLSKEELVSWIDHPCTQALRHTLQGDQQGLMEMLIGGAYSKEESIDATAQNYAKARGMAQAIDDILEYIETIAEDSEEE